MKTRHSNVNVKGPKLHLRQNQVSTSTHFENGQFWLKGPTNLESFVSQDDLQRCPLHSMAQKQSPHKSRPILLPLLSLNWNIVIIPVVQGRQAVMAGQMMWKSNKKLLPGDSSSWPSDTSHEGYELPMCLWSVIQVVVSCCLTAIDLHCLKGIWLNKWQHMVDESERSEWRKGDVELFSEKEREGVLVLLRGCPCVPTLLNLSLCCHTLVVCFQ